MQQLKQNVIDYFENCLSKHGDSAQGVDYNGQESQYKRFEILSQVAPLSEKSVLDVACGVGHFYNFLEERDLKPSYYKGVDITPGMVSYASKRLPQAEFALLDILSEPAPSQPIFDYVVCCGLFHLRANNSDKEWSEFCENMISRMYQYAKCGLAFNMMTDQVDFKVDRLYYADPTHYFNFCRHKLSRRVSLRHDYPLYEFTIYCYKA